MRQKLILFDIDGTLVTRDRINDVSFSVGLKKVLGIDDVNVVDIYGVNSGKTVRSIITETLEKKGLSGKEIPSKMNDVFNEMIEYYRENIESDQSFECVPHVEELLVELERRGHVLGLVTGNIEEIAKLKLKKVGLLDFFRIGGFGDSSKSRSELALKVIKKAGEKLKIKFDKKDVFIIGDTPLDIECGKELGVKTIAVSTGPFRIDELKIHDPDYWFNDFSDLLVPGTYVYVAQDLWTEKLGGFVSYYVAHGGAFFLDYLWVRKEYLETNLREALLEKVEEDVHEAGEDQYHVRFGARDRLYGEFFIQQGFDTLNQFEVTKYLKEVPKRKYTAENVDIFGYKFKRVI